MLRYLLIGVTSTLLVACGKNEAGATNAATYTPDSERVAMERSIDFSQVSRGGRLFQQNCAECHGANGQGDPNWRQRDADGLFPAPPLNGTGHAWHHPQKMLHYVIKNGSPGGQGRMPAWGEKLSDQEITDIIAWFQSKWPQPVYEAWYRMNENKKDGKS
jgi:mono/diheme cytochrome c family protein